MVLLVRSNWLTAQPNLPWRAIASVISGGTVPRFSPTTTAPAREHSSEITASNSSMG